MNLLFILLQYLLPHQALSRLTGRMAASRLPWLKNALITAFIRRYRVDMDEAAEPDPRAYADFNAFFTRALRPGARPLPETPEAICCPADGSISELGVIEHGRVLQAKGQTYSLQQLLGGDAALATAFDGGHFATIYLSPRDYHRVHMPRGGRLRRMIYVPGQLFSVNQVTAENVPDLFARNERAVCLFDTDSGPMAVILVGAMIVAGIETVWAGQVAPPPCTLRDTDYSEPRAEIELQRGAEMGRFLLGSTAIVLFGKDVARWEPDLAAGSPVRMGQTLGEIQARAAGSTHSA